jgi:3-phosphoshikimate 1-carboxyvinyltransferase
VSVPGDISSAAFFMVGAAITGGAAPDVASNSTQGSELILENVGVNPTRMGVVHILRMMGADIVLLDERMAGAEPVANIRVRARSLKGVQIPADMVSLAIDEFPILFIAAACAEGQTTVTGAEELRGKESDRIATMAEGLRKLGIDAKSTADGMIIHGGTITGGRVASRGDHRVAMAFAMAGLVSREAILIEDCANVDTSFPGFVETAASVGLRISCIIK